MACLEEIYLLGPYLPRLKGISLKESVISQSASTFFFDPHANNDFCLPLLLYLLLCSFFLLSLIVKERKVRMVLRSL